MKRIRTITLLLIVALASPALAAGSDICLLINEPTSDGKSRTWWGKETPTALPFTAHLTAWLKKAGLRVISSKSTNSTPIHQRYQRWPLEALEAINLGAVLGCRFVLIGQVGSKHEGELPVLKHVGLRVEVIAQLLEVTTNRVHKPLKLHEFGFGSDPTNAWDGAVNRLSARLGLRIRQSLLAQLSSDSLFKGATLIHLTGMTAQKQVMLFRQGILKTIVAIAGVRIVAFQRGRISLAVRFKSNIKTFDNADFLVVELSKLTLSGLTHKVLKGKKNQVWVQLSPAPIP